MSFTLNTQTHVPEERGLLPNGKYRVGVTEASYGPLKSGNGKAIAITLTVLEGQFANRKLWARFIMEHTNATTVRIGQDQLFFLLKALGIVQFGANDVPSLISKTFVVTTYVKKGKDGNKDTNEIAWDKVAADTGPGTVASPSAGGSAPGAPAKPSWVKPAAA